MSEQKIIIEITESNVPPKVFVDGEEVKVVTLDYQYETRTVGSPGEHKLNLLIPSIVGGKIQTKGVAFNRNLVNK